MKASGPSSDSDPDDAEMDLDWAWEAAWDVGTEDDMTAVEASSIARDGLEVADDAGVAEGVRARCACCANRGCLDEPGVRELVRAELRVDEEGSAPETIPSEVSIRSFEEACVCMVRRGPQDPEVSFRVRRSDAYALCKV